MFTRNKRLRLKHLEFVSFENFREQVWHQAFNRSSALKNPKPILSALNQSVLRSFQSEIQSFSSCCCSVRDRICLGGAAESCQLRSASDVLLCQHLFSGRKSAPTGTDACRFGFRVDVAIVVLRSPRRPAVQERTGEPSR